MTLRNALEQSQQDLFTRMTGVLEHMVLVSNIALDMTADTSSIVDSRIWR